MRKDVAVTVVVVLLAVALVAAVAVIVVLRQRLRTAQAEIAAQDRAIDELTGESTTPRGVLTAGKMVRKAVETATRMREEGVGSTFLSSLEEFTTWALEDRTAIARVAGPDGLVTIFFSDIEGSTALNNALGDEQWVKLLAAHDELVETYVDRYRGHVVKTQGDGYMVVFSTPELAISAALDIQRALGANWNRSRHLRRTPIRVRIGLHTGTAIEKGGDYFGQNVALAARVAAQAQGGEILVTSEIADELGGVFSFVPAEATELKGFEGDHELWHVVGRA